MTGQRIGAWIAGVLAGVMLAGCTVMPDITRGRALGEVPAAPRDYRVTHFAVDVPETLNVSEAARYYPNADIVWRGEPYGNRYEQIEAIFEEAALPAIQPLDGRRPVRVSIQVEYFHALTEKARATVGGVHRIRFWIAVFDSRTGELIEGPRHVKADLRAYGGARALAAERQGRGQRVRIVEKLSEVIRAELTAPVVPGSAPESGLFAGLTSR